MANFEKMQHPNDEFAIDKEASGNMNEGRWSDAEHVNFLKALKRWSRDWKRVAAFVRSRTSTQCRSHAQKFIAGLEKQGKTLDNFLLHEFDENMVVPMDFSGDGDMSKTVTESNCKDEDDSCGFKSQNEASQSDIKMRKMRDKDQKAQKSEAEKSKHEKNEPDSNNVL